MKALQWRRWGLGVIALACGLGAASAQLETPRPPQPPKAEKTNTLTLTNENLLGQLESMGYDVKELEPGRCQITTEVSGWKQYVMVEFSQDKSRVWLSAAYGFPTEHGKIPPEALLTLLEENGKFGDERYSYDRVTNRLMIQRSFPNQNLTARTLRQTITDFDALIRKQSKNWKKDNFQPVETATPEAKAEMAKLKGTWKAVEANAMGQPISAADLEQKKVQFVFDGDKLVIKMVGINDIALTIRLDPIQTPGHLDLRATNALEKAIYKLEGDTLTICVAANGKPRPTKFEGSKEDSTTLYVFKKIGG